jgi:hypothetical protein
MPKRKDALLAAAALAVVVAVLAVGFYSLGPRGKQRALNADARRVEDLQSIARQFWMQRPKQLPATLAELPPSPPMHLNDPVTNAPYEYHPQSGASYELCAIFATDSATDGAAGDGFPLANTFWNHPRGRHCYQLDASQPGY